MRVNKGSFEGGGDVGRTCGSALALVIDGPCTKLCCLEEEQDWEDSVFFVFLFFLFFINSLTDAGADDSIVMAIAFK